MITNRQVNEANPLHLLLVESGDLTSKQYLRSSRVNYDIFALGPTKPGRADTISQVRPSPVVVNS
jgi:hypothetical protein